MAKKNIRKEIHNIMLKHNVDMVALPAKVGLALGIEYITFKGNTNIQGINFDEKYVPIKNEDLETILKVVKKDFNEIHLYELTEEDVNMLLEEVVFGSLYIADYDNTFGVNPYEVSNYADGFLEVKDEYNSFYDYIQSVEFID